MNETAEVLRQFVKENFLFGQETTFADDASFLELGIVDSTGVLELVAFLEEQYQITIDDEELVPENLDAIDRLVRFVERKRGQNCLCGQSCSGPARGAKNSADSFLSWEQVHAG